MGGTSSQPVASSAGGGEEESVFSLSAGLQERMAQEFNNEQIANLFGSQMQKLAERNVQQKSQIVAEKTQLEEHMTKFREQNSQRQQGLDQTIEGIEDRFTDLSTGVEYDMSRLEKKYMSKNNKQGDQVLCLTERINVASCYKGGGGGDCDKFIEQLSDCVEKSVTS